MKRQRMLGTKDVAQILGVSPQYVWMLSNADVLPHEVTSAGRVFQEDDILEYKREREKRAKNDRRFKGKFYRVKKDT